MATSLEANYERQTPHGQTKRLIGARATALPKNACNLVQHVNCSESHNILIIMNPIIYWYNIMNLLILLPKFVSYLHQLLLNVWMCWIVIERIIWYYLIQLNNNQIILYHWLYSKLHINWYFKLLTIIFRYCYWCCWISLFS